MEGGEAETPPARPTAHFTVGCYNVLCSTYAVKWGEREGVSPDGSSNWAKRWPSMCEILRAAGFGVVCLQEVEHTDVDRIIADLGTEYACRYFKHEKRPPDGLLIALRRDTFEEPAFTEAQFNGVCFGRADVLHRSSQRSVGVVTCHCRGGNAEQLRQLAAFAAAPPEVDVVVVAGDFNEDFQLAPDSTGPSVRCPLNLDPCLGYSTLLRGSGEPTFSRPPHKQAEDQSSGKGKVDWIFVWGKESCGVRLSRDAQSREAILASHGICEATGQWPSDHGAEALMVSVNVKE